MKLFSCLVSFFFLLLLQSCSGIGDLAKAKEQLFRLTNLIYQRFEFGQKYRYQFFLGSMNFGVQTWNILKYKFCEKMVTDNSSFLMIFGGSSVTAGKHIQYVSIARLLFYARRINEFPMSTICMTNLVVNWLVDVFIYRPRWLFQCFVSRYF